MISALTEGVAAVVLPCTLALLLPCLGIVLGARSTAPWAAGGVIVGAALGAWVRFSGWWFDQPLGLGLAAVAVVLVLLSLVGIWSDRADLTAAAAAGVGWIAAWLWVPCVGPQLGEIINSAIAQPWSQLIPTLTYVLGVLLILVLIGAVGYLHPALSQVRDHRAATWVGLGIIGLLAFTMIFGLYDDVLAELSKRSSY